jgi:hypothetical protein
MRLVLFSVHNLHTYKDISVWEAKTKVVDSNVHKINLFEDESPLSYEEVIEYWGEDLEFRNFYFSILHNIPFDAFFWENPPVTRSNIKQAYEFVLVNTPQLAKVRADPNPFQDRFKSNRLGQSVVAFENLGGDAELIVPCPVASQNIYAHFASFIRGAPEKQKHDLIISVANSLNRKINDEPTWVSTSGLGVYWLHIRLDTRPKYYSYQPYRQYV